MSWPAGQSIPVHAAEPGGACSIIAFPGTFPSTLTLLVGRATTDTLKDPDPPRYQKIRQELDGPAVFGQVIEVGRVGGYTGTDGVILDGHDHFVFVPWGVASDCGYAKWRASHRWLPIDRDSFLWGNLRSADRWIDGRPTLDVQASHPLLFHRPPRRADERLALTPSELFELYMRLPTREALDTDPEVATAAIVRWLRENPDFAQAFPVTEHLRNLYGRAFEQYGSRMEHPFAGTYEWTLRVDGRVVRRVRGEVRQGVGSDVGRWKRLTPPPYSELPPEYSVRVALPRGPGDSPCVGRLWVGREDSPGERPASVDANLLLRCLGNDRNDLMEWGLPLMESIRGDDEVSGRLAVEAGSTRFRQVLVRPGLPSVSVEAVRPGSDG